VVLLPVLLALAAPPRGRAGRTPAVGAVGPALRRHPAVDRGLPLVGPHFWHHHFGKIAAAWSLAFLLPFAGVFGAHTALAGLVHALLAEYIPFILLLVALFTVSGGIYPRQPARHAAAQRGHAVDRRRAGQLHGHHGRVHAA
jgi:hypothetical protein